VLDANPGKEKKLFQALHYPFLPVQSRFLPSFEQVEALLRAVASDR
jgi:hypothetical protein